MSLTASAEPLNSLVEAAFRKSQNLMIPSMLADMKQSAWLTHHFTLFTWRVCSL